MENFSSLQLSPLVARAIRDMGFEKPSPIQAETLPILLGEDTDFIGLAATGTGKTAAFSIPLLEKIDPNHRGTQALIMCPTRELTLQVADQVSLLGKHMKIRALPIYGGAGYEEQIRGLKMGAPIVVGTPGRLIDHIERGRLKLDDVRVVVLDEADEMISMGFREDMETILSNVPEESRRTWLFSAPMSPSVRKVADEFLTDPQQVQVNRSEMLSSTVEQYYYMTQEKNKPEILCKLIDSADDFYGVIFCQTKNLVVDLTRYLNERGYKADSLHGDKTQAAREMTLADFRSKRVKICVCTDVAARGLDVKDVTHVINYSIPRELDNYVHRIGRTARSGKAGIAMALVTPSHRHLLGKIERLTKSKIIEGVIPTRKAVGEKKVNALLSSFQEQKTFARAIELLSPEWREALGTMSPEEVAGRFLAMKFPEVFSESFEERPRMAPRPQRPAYADRAERGDREERPRRERPRFERERPEREGDSLPRRKPHWKGPKKHGNYPPRRKSKYQS
ncbi:MAG TPA: DEAD/DEAH box helicase [Bdellovibrionales bacterium]|nr:DEAD/DEAH box helicase [Bdellovibrionales bacterium]